MGAGRLRRLRLRWVHLLLGGALLMPYFLLVTVVIGVVAPGAGPVGHPGRQVAAYVLSLPLAAATALLPLARTLESAAARALCQAPGGEPVPAPADSWAARRRTAVWFTLHVGLGAPVGGATLAVPPAVAALVAAPFSPGVRETRWHWYRDAPEAALWTAPVAGIALLAALVAAVWAAGALLARCAPALLGPTPADLLAAAEARAAALAARDRIARELHDSVGHALSAVSLQAGAARTVLGTDPEFVRRALTAIEETARRTTGELDAVLGLLRAGEPPDAPGDAPRRAPDGRGTAPRRPPGPTLDGLDDLLESTRAAGAPVTLATDPPTREEFLRALPPPLSREAYRILQEGLANVLRHAPRAPAAVSLAVREEEEGELVITVENPVRPRRGGAARDPRPGGGSGLRGIADRADALGGSAGFGAHGGRWRLTVRLPLGGAG